MVCLVYARLSCWAATCAVTSTTSWASTKSEIAREALDGSANSNELSAISSGQPAESVTRQRQKFSLPKVEAFLYLVEQTASWASGKEQFGQGLRYGLNRREPFSLFLRRPRGHRHNPAERAPATDWNRRKNWLFAGGPTRWQKHRPRMTIIETAKLNGLTHRLSR